MSPLGPDFRQAERGRVAFRQYLVQLSPELAIIDTLTSYRIESPAISTGGGGFMAFSALFDGPIIIHASDRETITIERRAAPSRRESAEFRVTVRSPAWGERSRSFRYQPRSLPTSVRDSIENAVRESGRQIGRSISQIQEILQFIALPDNQPPVRAAYLASNGFLWLEREEFAARARWLILNRDLLPVAHVSAPRGRRGRLTADMDGEVWLVEQDALGIQSAVRYRIRGLR